MRGLLHDRERLNFQLDFFLSIDRATLASVIAGCRSDVERDAAALIEAQIFYVPPPAREEPREFLSSTFTLFGINENDLGPIDEKNLGAFFGYRRSTDDADIIKFYVEMSRIQGSNLIRFRNLFVRKTDSWVNQGFGFSAAGYTYLIGHAKTRDGITSLGMRCFALKEYIWAGGGRWLVGPVLTIDTSGLRPISAKVALVPAHDHKSYRTMHQPNDSDIFDSITRKIEPSTIDQDIDFIFEKGVSYAFNYGEDDSVPRASDYIQFHIRNNTFSTVYSEHEALPTGTAELKMMREIWEAERRMASRKAIFGILDKTYLEALKSVLSSPIPPS